MNILSRIFGRTKNETNKPKAEQVVEATTAAPSLQETTEEAKQPSDDFYKSNLWITMEGPP